MNENGDVDNQRVLFRQVPAAVADNDKNLNNKAPEAQNSHVGKCSLGELANEFKTSTGGMVNILRDGGVEAGRDGQGRIVFDYEDACEAVAHHYRRQEASGREYALEFIKSVMPDLEKMMAEICRREFHQMIALKNKIDTEMIENTIALRKLIEDNEASVKYLLRLTSQIDLANVAGLSGSLSPSEDWLTVLSSFKPAERRDQLAAVGRSVKAPLRECSEPVDLDADEARDEDEDQSAATDSQVSELHLEYMAKIVAYAHSLSVGLSSEIENEQDDYFSFFAANGPTPLSAVKLMSHHAHEFNDMPEGVDGFRDAAGDVIKWAKGKCFTVNKEVVCLGIMIMFEGQIEIDELLLYLTI